MKSRTCIIITFSVFVAACGGGGGSGGGANLSATSGTSAISPVVIGTYDLIEGPTIASASEGVYARDLNGSGSEEVVIAGRSSQSFSDSNNIEDWQNFEMQVFGWNTGKFGRETDSWFRPEENSILGTEPSVHFADFDGDGDIDMSVAHGTDNGEEALYGSSHVYFNTGSSSFEETLINHDATWAHDSAVADFDGDGFDDFLIGSYNGNMSLAFGSEDQSFQLYQGTSTPVGVGLAAGDFLNDGTMTIVSTGGSNNQELYSWSTTRDELQLTRESNLPDSRFELPKWDDERAVQEDEYHTIRAVTFDFDGNGVDDVVTISTLDKDDNVHGYTEVQFLRNDGTGTFTDVTDDILREFDTNQIASYNPVLIDVNDDGLLDLMMSTGASVDEPSTSILVQGTDGTFTEEYVDEFATYNETLKSLSGKGTDAPSHSIVAGPDGGRYLVSVGSVNTVDTNGDYEHRVFLSEIGNNGTITTSSTISALKSQWPWMTDAQADEILSYTALGNVDGMPVIDYREAMAPAGGLRLPLSSGGSTPMIGYVSGVDFSASDLAAVAQDGFDRGFRVDLSPSSLRQPSGFLTNRVHLGFDRSGQVARSAGFVGGSSYEWNSLYLQQDEQAPDEFTLSLPSLEFSDDWYLTAQFTQLNRSPWLDMSGFWGEVNQSEITEGVVSYSSTTWVGSFGVMQSQTDITPGLITDISDIWAVWGEVGWQDPESHIGFYAGIDPYVTHGVVDVALPTSTDVTGKVRYSNDTLPLDTVLSSYLRFASQFEPARDLEVSFGAVARPLHGLRANAEASYRF